MIENVVMKDSQPVQRCILLSANTVQWHIDEMVKDVERTLVYEFPHCKFSIQLESTFSSSNILMAYVRYYSLSLKCIVDKFLFAKYLKGDAKDEKIFLCYKGYLKKHNVPLGNITVMATKSAPAIVGHYRGFATLPKGKVPNVCTVHFVLRRHHIVAKKLWWTAWCL